MKIDNTIIDHMARAIFCALFADAMDALGKGGVAAGKDWFDIAPETPQEAYFDAFYLLGQLHEVNERRGVWTLFMAACQADCGDGDKAQAMFNDVKMQERFGSDLALQAMGHGASWFDNHKRFPLAFPTYFDADLTLGKAEELAAEA